MMSDEEAKRRARERIDKEVEWFENKLASLEANRDKYLKKAYRGFLVGHEEARLPDGSIERRRYEYDVVPENVKFSIGKTRTGDSYMGADYAVGPNATLIPLLLPSKKALRSPFGFKVFEGSMGQNQTMAFSFSGASESPELEEYFELIWSLEEAALKFLELNEKKVTNKRQRGIDFRTFIIATFKRWTSVVYVPSKDGGDDVAYPPQLKLTVVCKKPPRQPYGKPKGKGSMSAFNPQDDAKHGSTVSVAGSKTGSGTDKDQPPVQYQVSVFDARNNPLEISTETVPPGSRAFVYMYWKGLSFKHGIKESGEVVQLFMEERNMGGSRYSEIIEPLRPSQHQSAPPPTSTPNPNIASTVIDPYKLEREAMAIAEEEAKLAAATATKRESPAATDDYELDEPVHSLVEAGVLDPADSDSRSAPPLGSTAATPTDTSKDAISAAMERDNSASPPMSRTRPSPGDDRDDASTKRAKTAAAAVPPRKGETAGPRSALASKAKSTKREYGAGGKFFDTVTVVADTATGVPTNISAFASGGTIKRGPTKKA